MHKPQPRMGPSLRWGDGVHADLAATPSYLRRQVSMAGGTLRSGMTTQPRMNPDLRWGDGGFAGLAATHPVTPSPATQ